MIDADAGLLRLARSPPRSRLRSALIGVAWAVAALAVRACAAAFYQDITGFMILLPGVILAALAAGRVAGLTALFTCLCGGWVLVHLSLPGEGAGSARLSLVATVNFVVVGLFVTIVAASLRKTLRRLDASVEDRRTTDARMGETELELRAMVDQASAGIVRVGLDGVIQAANLRFAQILGTTTERLVGATTADLTHPDDIAPTRALLALAREGGTGQIEKRYFRADGSIVWAITSLQRLLDADARPRGFIAVIVDISEAKATEAALRESEERFRLMADTAPSPVWLTDEAGDVEFVNAALVAFYGLPADRLMGQMWKMTVHPDDQASVEAIAAAARPRHRPYDLECRFLRHDGAWRWSKVSVNPRFDGQGVFRGYVGMAFDVTESREAIDAFMLQQQRQVFLLALNDRLRNLVSPDAIMGEVSRSLAEALGVDRVGYGEIDDDELVTVRNAWVRPPLTDLSGEWTLNPLGSTTVAALRSGSIVRCDSVKDQTDIDAEAFTAIGAAALILAPVLRADKFRAMLFVHSSTPRVWSTEETALVEDLASRAFADIERARAQAVVRDALEDIARQERRQTFLLELADRLRRLTRPIDVMAEASRSMGQRLGTNRAGFGELDHKARVFRLYTDWTDGVASVAGQWPIEDFGGAVDLELQRGLTVAVEDVDLDPRTLSAAPAYRQIDIRAVASAPLMHDGRLTSFFHVHSQVPRVWTADELSLLGEVAERAWVEVERTRAQAEVAESEARFRAIADTAPVLIWVTGEDGKRAFVNQAYVAFMGGDYETVRLADWRTFVHPDDQAEMQAQSLAGEATGQPFALEARYRHRDGDYRRLRSFSRPRFNAKGDVIGFVGVAFDVTDAKRAEDDLKRINELLEERVGEALAEKAKAEADLMHAQRMEAVGRLTGGVAHDFNNLLTVVIGALDMILRSPDDAARRKKLGEAALAAARRGEGLTHQLLAFSRRQALRPQAVDLNALIVEGEPLLRRATGEAIDFKLKLRRGGARVSVDPAQFEAALLNLLVNARDALAARTGRSAGTKARITVQTASCTVEPGEVSELPPGAYVCVNVSDNGSGMDAETLTRVFEPFFTTKAVGKGTGLGLSQVYGFARQSGGGVKITSTPGRGTDIRLYLPPLDPAESVSEADDRTASAALPDGRRILLVEDDANVSAIAVELLVGLGLEVEAVETGPEALRILAESRFDVMLSDVVMPGGMTGIELARLCAERHPHLPILLTSGYAGDDVDEALADAPWPFLRKPYSGEQLRQALSDLLPIGD